MRKGIRNGLAGLILGASALSLGSCANTRDTAALGVLGMGLGAGAGSFPVFAAGVGTTAYATGEANRSQTNVYVNGAPYSNANGAGQIYTFWDPVVQQNVTVYVKPGEENLPLGEIARRRREGH